MKTKIHAIAGIVALLTIVTFWTSTLYTELFGTYAEIATVKSFILSGMFLLIPAMVIVGASGFSLAKNRKGKLIAAKMMRMRIAAANGILILLPSAFFLANKAASGSFDTLFYAIQALEIVAGATNMVLIGLNIRAGRAMTRQA